MKLSKVDRESVRMLFNGRCAYCGDPLSSRWHADHVEAVRREWWKKNGYFERPDNNRINNLFPSCPPCNIDKHAMTLEQWRQKLANGPDVLNRNQATYRHSIRFGLVQETAAPVVFYFERLQESESPRAPEGGRNDTEQA